MLQISGTRQLTASGEIGPNAGQPVRIFNIVTLSGATAGVSTTQDGGSGGTTFLTLTCPTVSTSAIWDFGEHGILFPNGAYWTKDANTASVTVSFSTEA
jgi:hypothetical protein